MFNRTRSVRLRSGAYIAMMVAGFIAGTGGAVQAQLATLRVVVADENDPTVGGNMKVNRAA